MKSRIRLLFVGFYNLFGPLHAKGAVMHHGGERINPLSYF